MNDYDNYLRKLEEKYYYDRNEVYYRYASGDIYSLPNDASYEAKMRYDSKIRYEEDPKIKNQKSLEQIPIEEIERFLRRKKLEKISK